VPASDAASPPEDGKLFVAANPWPLAAEAKRQGLPTDRFRESDLVPEDQVLVFDLDKLFAPIEDWKFDDGTPVMGEAKCPRCWEAESDA
jgi:hypothetical protein